MKDTDKWSLRVVLTELGDDQDSDARGFPRNQQK